MGPSPEADDVVDHAGRVHGLRNVFVADASIVPIIPRANVNLTCFVIGRRVADFLVG
jgi:choline dehydrogenase